MLLTVPLFASALLVPPISRVAPCPFLFPRTDGCPSRVAAPSMGASGAWDSEDETSLYKEIARASATKLGEPEDVLQGMSDAWVLIFNLGQHDEGVYTLQGRARGSSYVPSSFVLAFQSMDDADRFAQLLQADDFDLATPSRWDAEHLSSFCKVCAWPSPPSNTAVDPKAQRSPYPTSNHSQAGQFELSFVPDGSWMAPPPTNSYDVDAFDAQQLAAQDLELLAFQELDTQQLDALLDAAARESPPSTTRIGHGLETYADERLALERSFAQQTTFLHLCAHMMRRAQLAMRALADAALQQQAS